jgi:hypothetical protein
MSNRGRPAPNRPYAKKSGHPLYAMMKGLMFVMPGTDLTQPADPEWADRIDAE